MGFTGFCLLLLFCWAMDRAFKKAVRSKGAQNLASGAAQGIIKSLMK